MKIIISVVFLSVSLLTTSCSGKTHTHPSDKEEQVADTLHITSIKKVPTTRHASDLEFRSELKRSNIVLDKKKINSTMVLLGAKT